VTIAEVLGASAEYLERKGVDTPRLDAELLLSRALGLSRLELYTQHDRPLGEAERAAARSLVERRGRREPLAYVLGDWGFRRLTLRTDARALVPRPETELLVERALALVEGLAAPRILDVGTGTGAIALALASERPGARVVATDASAGALELARENAELLGIDVELLHAHVLDGVTGEFDLVVSNPPYVEAAELDGLQPEVRDWEPRAALLDDGQTEAIAAGARGVLDGWLLLECHEQRARSLAGTLESLGYAEVGRRRDLAGRDRIVEARWTGSSGR
jgi:release factor glutamine methyltransferase